MEQIQALNKNATWEITELPPTKHSVGCEIDVHKQI